MSLKKWFGENWVDISTTKDGKHPKCGRKMGDGRSYPKCVPASKAAGMSPKRNQQQIENVALIRQVVVRSRHMRGLRYE
jgi:hypothetical protein